MRNPAVCDVAIPIEGLPNHSISDQISINVARDMAVGGNSPGMIGVPQAPVLAAEVKVGVSRDVFLAVGG